MEDEKFISGYCRQTDCSRIVTAELEDGKLTGADCQFDNCPHQAECPIAIALTALQA